MKVAEAIIADNERLFERNWNRQCCWTAKDIGDDDYFVLAQFLLTRLSNFKTVKMSDLNISSNCMEK